MNKHVISKLVIIVLSYSIVNLSASETCAKMISTSQALEQISKQSKRSRILALLNEQSMVHQLEAWGVSSEEAQARINALSDKEIEELNQQLTDLPAGKDGVGSIVGAAVLIFIILLITDIAGVTDVFPFVKKK